jgi:YVTN family beta-propeller protein
VSSHALVVLNKLEHSLSCFDVDAGKELFRLPTSAYPHELCLSPDRSRLFVTEYGLTGVDAPGDGGNTIGVYDLRARARVATFSTNGYRRPHGVAAHASGHLFVTSEPSRTVLMFDLGGTLRHAVPVDQDIPHMTSVTPDGRTCFAANIGSNSLTALDVESATVLGHTTALGRPEGMAFSPDGTRLYVANREGAAIAIVDVATREIVGTVKTGLGPVRIAITPDGRRLATPLFYADAVQVIDVASGRVCATIPVGCRPVGLTLSPDGTRLFVSCELDAAVHVIDMHTFQTVRRLQTAKGPDSMVCLAMSEIA